MWSTLPQTLADIFNARVCMLSNFDFETQHGSIELSCGIEPTKLEEYSNQVRFDRWFHDERHYARPGTVHVGEDILPVQLLLATDFYQSWLKPQNLFHRLCVVLGRSGRSVRILSFLRPAGDGAFDRKAVQDLEQICPHLNQAIEVRDRL